jgi:hypothetical protein
MAYIPHTSHVTLFATLRRERLLPAPGEIIVDPGHRVEATEVVARAEINEFHRMVDLARVLGVPKDKVAPYMLKQEGDPVKKGEPIASRKVLLGMSNKLVPSPVDGRLVLFDEGKALLAAVTPFDLRAGLPGTVVNVIGSQGLVIEMTGALVEGVWGNGQDDFSVLRLLGAEPGEVLPIEQLELGMRGAILAAGTLVDLAELAKLSEVGIRGLILGHVSTEALPALQKAPFPVLVTDGFGAGGFSLPVFNLLKGNSGREVWVNAHPGDRFRGTRPEAIIPLPSPSEPPPPPVEGEALSEGKRVRVLRGPDIGRVGTVIGLSDKPMTLPSGIRSCVAAVTLEDEPGARTRPTISVAFANLELLE